MSRDKEQAKTIPIEYVLRTMRVNVPDRTTRYIRIPCPFHRSADEDFVIDTVKNHCYCMSPACDYHTALDPLALVMKAEGCSFPDAIKKLLNQESLSYERPPMKQPASPQQKLSRMRSTFLGSKQHMDKVYSYWGSRGIPNHIVNSFNLGYYLQYPIKQGMREHWRYSIPWFTNKGLVAISGRRDDQWAKENLQEGELLERVFGSKYMGPAVDKKNRIFNNRRLYDGQAFISRPFVFIQESEADVMSVETIGYPSVGSKLSPHIDALTSKVEVPIIIAQRDHGAGMMYARTVQDLIPRPAPIFEVPSPYKDTNDMLVDGTLQEWIGWVIRSIFGNEEGVLHRVAASQVPAG